MGDLFELSRSKESTSFIILHQLKAYFHYIRNVQFQYIHYYQIHYYQIQMFY